MSTTVQNAVLYISKLPRVDLKRSRHTQKLCAHVVMGVSYLDVLWSSFHSLCKYQIIMLHTRT